MFKLIKKIWDKMNEPQNEKVLIILLPCISILIAGFILAPRLLYYAGSSIAKQEETAGPPPTEHIDAAAYLKPSPTTTEIPVETITPPPPPSPQSRLLSLSPL